MRIIRLQTSDKVVIEVDYEIIKCSETIRKALQNLGDGDDVSVFPLPNVNSEILKKVLTWATYHKNDVGMVAGEDNKMDMDLDENKETDICDWDKEFFNVDQDTFYNITLAAHYLDIQPLLEYTYKMVANMIKGKTTEEMRKMFSLVNDFTSDEEEEMRQ